jgi:hypothetical protein
MQCGNTASSTAINHLAATKWIQSGHLPFTIYHLPPTTYHLPLTTYHLPLTIRLLPFTMAAVPARDATRRNSLIPSPSPNPSIRLPERSSRKRVDCEPSAIHLRPNPHAFGMEWKRICSLPPREIRLGGKPTGNSRERAPELRGSSSWQHDCHPSRTPLTPTRCPMSVSGLDHGRPPTFSHH